MKRMAALLAMAAALSGFAPTAAVAASGSNSGCITTVPLLPIPLC